MEAQVSQLLAILNSVLRAIVMNDWVKSFEKARSTALLFNYHLQCSKTELPIISGLRGAYQLAGVGDGVVRQWIHCPESLSSKAHRAPLWAADINLRRRRSGGVWLSSHTSTHIGTHRETQTRHRLKHMHIHSQQNRERISYPAPFTDHSVPSLSYCNTPKMYSFQMLNTAQPRCHHRCGHEVSFSDVNETL